MILQIGHVVLEGIDRLRKRPWVPLVWGGVAFGTFVVLVLAVVGVALATTGEIPRGSDSGFTIFLGGAVIVLALLFFCVFACASYRMVLRPEQGTLGYLRLGMVELRMFALMLLMGMGWLLAAFVTAILAGLLAAIAGGPRSPLVPFVWIPSVLAVLFLWVRLSLVGVISFAEGKVGLTRSWMMTRPVFWRLLGIHALLLAMLVVGVVVFYLIVAAVRTAEVGMPAMVLGWVRILEVFAYVIVMGAAVAGLYAPHAAIYRALSPQAVDKTSDVFS